MSNPTRIASFYATLTGYRVTVTEADRIIASEHFRAAGRVVHGEYCANNNAAIDAAYQQAKQFAAQHGA